MRRTKLMHCTSYVLCLTAIVVYDNNLVHVVIADICKATVQDIFTRDRRKTTHDRSSLIGDNFLHCTKFSEFFE